MREVGEPFATKYGDTVETIVEVRHNGHTIQVIRLIETDAPHLTYWVLEDEIVRHPACAAEAAIRALGMYLHDNS